MATTGYINFQYSTDGGAGGAHAFSHQINFSDFPNTTWKKIKYKRVGTALRLYIDDVLVETYTIGTDDIFTSTRKLRVGAAYNSSASAITKGLDGWIDSLIITTGADIPNPTTATVDGTASGAFCPYVSQGQVRAMVTAITGLDHLEGEEVSVQADGIPENSQTYEVVSGDLTPELPNPAAVVHVGLPYEAKIKLLKASDGNPAGTGQMKKRRISDCGFRVHRSLGFKIGLDEDNLSPVILGDPELPLRSGDLKKLPKTKWDEAAQLLIISDLPVPVFLTAIILKSEVETF